MRGNGMGKDFWLGFAVGQSTRQSHEEQPSERFNAVAGIVAVLFLLFLVGLIGWLIYRVTFGAG